MSHAVRRKYLNNKKKDEKRSEFLLK